MAKPVLLPGQQLDNGRWIIVSASTWPAVVAVHTMLYELYQWTPSGTSVHTGGSVSPSGHVVFGDWTPIAPPSVGMPSAPPPPEVVAFLEAHR